MSVTLAQLRNVQQLSTREDMEKIDRISLNEAYLMLPLRSPYIFYDI